MALLRLKNFEAVTAKKDYAARRWHPRCHSKSWPLKAKGHGTLPFEMAGNSAVHSSAFLQRFVWQNVMRSARLVIRRQRWRRRSRIEQGSDPIGLT
jgi:hypothetical protein